MKSFEDIVSQYAQDIPENTSQTHNFTSLTLVVEKVRFCLHFIAIINFMYISFKRSTLMMS